MTRPPTIAFFGNFGTQNLGNECTLRAIIGNTRKQLPHAIVSCVCPRPRETAEAHGIPASLISYRFAKDSASAPSSDNAAKRLIRRLVVRVPLEVGEWIRVFRTLGGTDKLVMTGTGMLGDFGISPLGLHYEILKWSIVAKMRGCQLLFVSVGAGPIRHPLSRWIVKAALSLADYRSYRDQFSYDYLEFIGFNTSRDHVYPDLAFSLLNFDASATPPGSGNGAGRVVGLGLMEYYGQHRSPEEGERTYQRYIERVARFASWLLSQGHQVRLLVGDLAYDRRVKGDLLRLLDQAGPFDRAQVIDEPLTSPEDLIDQLAKTDLVVATRFHNVLLALMLGRPVIALSYHEKLRSLMAEVGVPEYSVEAEELDVAGLIERFRRLSEDETFTSSTKMKADGYRDALDEQYARMFREFLESPTAAVAEGYSALERRSSPGAAGGPVS
jgi:polysaccharide pyruvyl transferase WcaK-like protein